MKVAEISAFNTFSVGKIMNDIKTELEAKGIECKIFYARGNKSTNIRIGNSFKIYLNALFARLLDNDGFCEASITKKLIYELDEFKPDIIHLHCLHGYYFNSKVFFEYLRNHPKIKVIWTMHDNWAITGHCAYFDLRKCNKWKKECNNCPAKKDYPKSFFDKSTKNQINKVNVFSSLPKEQMIIVSPSEWLDNVINESYLNKYQHIVIYNGIDITRFKDYSNPRKKTLLAIASVWDERKNLKKVIQIAKALKEWNVLVVGKVTYRRKIDNLHYIDRTESLDELIKIYNESSILINPTLADNLPTVNIEAQLCGLKVITFDTGGSKETNCGNLYIIDNNTRIDDAFLNNILSNHKVKSYAESFSRSVMVDNYLKLINRMRDNYE